MKELIEALQIFLKYDNPDYPTHCEHDVLMVVSPGFDEVSKEDRVKLKQLGFHWNESYDCWASYKFGSA